MFQADENSTSQGWCQSISAFSAQNPELDILYRCITFIRKPATRGATKKITCEGVPSQLSRKGLIYSTRVVKLGLLNHRNEQGLIRCLHACRAQKWHVDGASPLATTKGKARRASQPIFRSIQPPTRN
jgi:hypothetical protein